MPSCVDVPLPGRSTMGSSVSKMCGPTAASAGGVAGSRAYDDIDSGLLLLGARDSEAPIPL